MHPILAALSDGDEAKYPRHLEAKFKRIFDAILNQWGTPNLDDYFNSLFIDDRGGRQGFPADVMGDIFFLYSLHERLKASGRDKEIEGDVWKNEEVRRGLEEECIEYSPRGFFRAIESGNARAIELFLKAGVDVELKNQVGWTPLMVSAFMGSEEGATLLLNAGANVHARDDLGYGPVHWAALQGYPNVVAMLLQKGADANVKSNKGLTPLLQAAARGHGEVVQLLLSKGAAVNEADIQGWTPLHKAVSNKHLDVVRLLIGANANPLAQHAGGATPISIAKEMKNQDILAAVSK
jgi:ankyrin repeat protein